MDDIASLLERRTATDIVFEALYADISTLRLLPNAKLSEADVARRFGVSRQPVRDAFNRLANLDLLRIRPQKATVVRGFSRSDIAHARFVRLAVELEVIRGACAIWDHERAEILALELSKQQRAVETGQMEEFHGLDYRFHKLICELGGRPMAFETIESCKQKIDRLCMLSLDRQNETITLFEDHRAMAEALERRDAPEATAIARIHLDRLDETIEQFERVHADYFE